MEVQHSISSSRIAREPLPVDADVDVCLCRRQSSHQVNRLVLDADRKMRGEVK
jgi:hypothetical protein